MDRKRKYKSGHAKLKAAEQKRLQLAAKDPKQKKLNWEQAQPSTSSVTAIVEEARVEEETEVRENPEVVHVEVDLDYHTDDNELEEDADDKSIEEQTVRIREDEQLDREKEREEVDRDKAEHEEQDDWLFVKPKTEAAVLLNWLEAHPIQPEIMKEFKGDLSKVYLDRKWVSMSVTQNRAFCWICLAFSSASSPDSLFSSDGYPVNKRLTQAVERHENSRSHHSCVDSYLQFKADKTALSLLGNKTRQEAEFLRTVLERVISVVTFLSTSDLPFRGHRGECSASLFTDITKGNFMSALEMLSEYDSVLRQHLENVQRQAVKKGSKSDSRGRGRTLTLISKSSFNKLLEIMKMLVVREIVEDIADSGFGLMVDSTTDVSGLEIAGICVRYVTSSGKTVEHLLGVLELHDLTGEGYFAAIKKWAEQIGLRLQQCVGFSFDGAANMRSDNKGLQRMLKDNCCPNAIYTWCYAHVLDLCACDGLKEREARNFIGLLDRTRNFIAESSKRLDAWRQEESKKRLVQIGQTRWSGKADAVRVIMGELPTTATSNISTFSSRQSYTALVCALADISTSQKFDAGTNQNADSLLSNWLKQKTIHSLVFFQFVFGILQLPTKALQTAGLPMDQAHQCVQSALAELSAVQVDYITQRAKEFTDHANELLKGRCTIETQISEGRLRKKKMFPDEKAKDDPPTDPEVHFSCSVLRPVLDQICTSLRSRFEDHGELVKLFSNFSPKNFPLIKADGVSADCLKEVAAHSQVDASDLARELEAYAALHKPSSCTDGADCTACAAASVHELSRLGLPFKNLRKAMRFLLTLPCTQVSCERAFSSLKIVKTRLRSTLSESMLENFLILSVEKTITKNLKKKDIIERFARSSNELFRALSR